MCSRLCAGGAERVGVVLSNGFAEKGHEVYLLSNTNLDIAYPISSSVHVVNIFHNTTNKIKKWIGAVRQLKKEIKKHHPDVILGIEETCSLIAKIASRGQRTHVICTEHNSYQRPPSAPMGRMEWFMKYQMTKIYECVTVLTEADRDYIGSRLKNVVVMPNPLSLQPVEAVPGKKKVVLAAGRLDVWHYKGFDLLIRAYAKAVSSFKNQVSSSSHSEAAEPSTAVSSLKEYQDSRFKIQDSKESEPETNLKPETKLISGTTETCNLKLAEDLQESSAWRLQIAGTGSEESLDYLKQLCKENGVEDTVDFLGFRTDIEELYKQSEIFVLSSRYEGFGLVLIEAMSQGCACVACDYNGRQREIFEELKDGRIEELKSGSYKECKNGILCEPDNVEALAEGIKRMMEDEEYRKEVQRNSVERSKAYSVDRTIQRWENLFDQMIY